MPLSLIQGLSSNNLASDLSTVGSHDGFEGIDDSLQLVKTPVFSQKAQQVAGVGGQVYLQMKNIKINKITETNVRKEGTFLRNYYDFNIQTYTISSKYLIFNLQ